MDMMNEHYEKYCREIKPFAPTGNASMDAERYVDFENELADNVKQFMDEDGEFGHPLKVPLCDRRNLRKYLHKLLKYLCRGEARKYVDKAAHGDQAIANLRGRYDVRSSKAAQSRVKMNAGDNKSPYDLEWEKYYKFEYGEGGGPNGQKYDIMEVKAKNGTIVRSTSSMTSDVVCEIPKGTLVLVARRAMIKHNNKDVERAGIARPCHGYVSMKMLQKTNRKPPKEFYDPTPEEIAAREAKEQEELNAVGEVPDDRME